MTIISNGHVGIGANTCSARHDMTGQVEFGFYG